MKTISLSLLLIALLSLATPSIAKDQFLSDLDAAREVYLEATNGEKRKVRKAIRAIKKLESKYPRHPLVLAYKGGALALRGINIGKRPLDRMRETEEGLNILDRTLRLLPRFKGNDVYAIEAKLVIAFVFVNLPDGVFHRLREGTHLINQLMQYPKFDQLPQGMQAAIYLAAAISADSYQQPADYKHYLNLTIETDPNGRSGKDAKALLAAIQD